jgi:hypothetical protein
VKKQQAPVKIQTLGEARAFETREKKVFDFTWVKPEPEGPWNKKMLLAVIFNFMPWHNFFQGKSS